MRNNVIYFRYFLQILFPMIYILGVFLYCKLKKICHIRPLIVRFLILFYLLHIPSLIINNVGQITYRIVDSKYYISNSMNINYFNKTHILIAVPIYCVILVILLLISFFIFININLMNIT